MGAFLAREGLPDLARSLRDESGHPFPVDDSLALMHSIQRRLDPPHRDVGPALQWVTEQQGQLSQAMDALRASKAAPLPIHSADAGDEERKGRPGRGGGDAGEEEEPVGLAGMQFPPPSPRNRGAREGEGVSGVVAQMAAVQSLQAQLHSLHFDLHRIRFLQLLTATSPPSSSSSSPSPSPSTDTPSPPSSHGQAALLYAQTHFGLFAEERIDDIRKLSGLLLFYPNLSSSPYANLLTPPTSPTSVQGAGGGVGASPYASPSALSSHLQAASAAFAALFLRLRALPPVPPLLTLLRAASAACPQLAHYQQLRVASSQALEVDIGGMTPFHSTFICPVTREASHEGNEPVMLQCGHLISAAAMEKIVRGLRMTRKFKCPTCPREQTPQDVITVTL